MTRAATVIYNPAAGGGRATRSVERVLSHLRSHGINCAAAPTADLAHAATLAAQAHTAGALPVALGGDGLVGAVASGLAGHPGATFAIVPAGRGNDLARVLGISTDLALACAVVAEGAPCALDLGTVADGFFVGIASAGFDSDANRIANEAPAWLGGLAYAYGALRALLGWRPATFTLKLDGETQVFRGYTVAAANSQAYGGGMFLAPQASLEDGLLDVVVVTHVSKLRFLRNLPKVFSGRHITEDNVHVFRVKELHLAADRPFTLYADGDPVAPLPLVLGTRAAAVNVLTPR